MSDSLDHDKSGNLLLLDGGGIRGYYSLLLLGRLMQEIEQLERKILLDESSPARLAPPETRASGTKSSLGEPSKKIRKVAGEQTPSVGSKSIGHVDKSEDDNDLMAPSRSQFLQHRNTSDSCSTTTTDSVMSGTTAALNDVTEDTASLTSTFASCSVSEAPRSLSSSVTEWSFQEDQVGLNSMDDGQVSPPDRNEGALLPCDYFDSIAATSTGGLVAVMLGRLRMNVDECLNHYENMSNSKRDTTKVQHDMFRDDIEITPTTKTYQTVVKEWLSNFYERECTLLESLHLWEKGWRYLDDHRRPLMLCHADYHRVSGKYFGDYETWEPLYLSISAPPGFFKPITLCRDGSFKRGGVFGGTASSLTRGEALITDIFWNPEKRPSKPLLVVQVVSFGDALCDSHDVQDDNYDKAGACSKPASFQQPYKLGMKILNDQRRGRKVEDWLEKQELEKESIYCFLDGADDEQNLWKNKSADFKTAKDWFHSYVTKAEVQNELYACAVRLVRSRQEGREKGPDHIIAKAQTPDQSCDFAAPEVVTDYDGNGTAHDATIQGCSTENNRFDLPIRIPHKTSENNTIQDKSRITARGENSQWLQSPSETSSKRSINDVESSNDERSSVRSSGTMGRINKLERTDLAPSNVAYSTNSDDDTSATIHGWNAHILSYPSPAETGSDMPVCETSVQSSPRSDIDVDDNAWDRDQENVSGSLGGSETVDGQNTGRDQRSVNQGEEEEDDGKDGKDDNDNHEGEDEDGDATDSVFWGSENSSEIQDLDDGHPFLQVKDEILQNLLRLYMHHQQTDQERQYVSSHRPVPYHGSQPTRNTDIPTVTISTGPIPASGGGPGAGSGTRKEKRKRSEADDDYSLGNSHSDNNNSNRNDDDASSSPTTSVKRSCSSASKQTFACPFCKKDPLQYRECYAKRLTRIGDVKQHLLRSHRAPVYCPLCMETFSDESERDGHTRARTCDIRPPVKHDGVTESQRTQLRKRTDTKMPEEEQWFRIFEILFPGHPRPSSAYIDECLEIEVQRMRDVFMEEGPAIIARYLEPHVIWTPLNTNNDGSSGEGGDGPSAAFSNQLIREAIQEVVRLFESGRATALPHPSPPEEQERRRRTTSGDSSLTSSSSSNTNSHNAMSGEDSSSNNNNNNNNVLAGGRERTRVNSHTSVLTTSTTHQQLLGTGTNPVLAGMGPDPTAADMTFDFISMDEGRIDDRRRPRSSDAVDPFELVMPDGSWDGGAVSQADWMMVGESFDGEA